MADNRSIFSDDWRECLMEQYKDVVRRNDTLTETSLVRVLHEVGFRDDELRELKLYATMRADELAGDFVPDLDIPHDDHSHHHHAHDVPTHEEPYAEERPLVVAGVDIEPPEEAEHVHDELVEAIVESAEALAEDVPEETDDDTPDPDAPIQMSLF